MDAPQNTDGFSFSVTMTGEDLKREISSDLSDEEWHAVLYALSTFEKFGFLNPRGSTALSYLADGSK